MCQQVQFEHAVLRGTEQDGIVFQEASGLDDTVVRCESCLHRGVEGHQLLRFRVEEHNVPVARENHQSIGKHLGVEVILVAERNLLL